MNTELNFPRRLLAGLTALALLLMLALPVWAEGEETEKLPVSINSVEDLLQLVTDCRLDSWSEDRTVDLNTDLDLTGVDFAGIPTFSGTFDGNGQHHQRPEPGGRRLGDGLLPLHPGRRRGT